MENFLSPSPLNRTVSGIKRLTTPTKIKPSHVYSLAIVDVRRPGVVYNMEVRWFDKIRDVKLVLRKITNESITRHHLFLPRGANELSNSLTLHDVGIIKGGFKLRLVVDSSLSDRVSVLPFNSALEVSDEINDLIDNTREGLTSMKPTKVDEFDASGGVYFIRKGKGEKVAVFKPQDEEPGMVNNPHGRAQDPLREFFSPGQGCFREVAAYIFDVNSFASVPPTSVVLCDHSSFTTGPKVGSLQKFVKSYSIYGDLGPAEIAKISDLELQKIALFDLRILNCDRNTGNILLCHKSDNDNDYEDDNDIYELVPIDHGYSMPSRLSVSDFDWCWFGSDQVKRPVCPEIIEYIRSLNINEIITKTLEQVHLGDEHVYLLQCVHHFVLMAIELGFTLHEIAVFMARDFNDEEKPSRFEVVFTEIEEYVFRYFDVKISSHGNSLATSGTGGNDINSPPQRAENYDGMALKRLSSLCGYEGEHTNGKSFRSPGPETSCDKHETKATPTIKSDIRLISEPEHNNDTPSTPSTLPRTPLTRIASFAAFGSDKIYSYNKDSFGRQQPKALKTRNSLLQSAEFKKFRFEHAISKFRALLKREKFGSFDKTLDSS